MDGTFNRVVPEYLKPLDELAVVGAFRSVIRDVEIDLEGQLIKTVLGDHFEKPKNTQDEETSASRSWKYTPDLRRLSLDDLRELAEGHAHFAEQFLVELNDWLAKSEADPSPTLVPSFCNWRAKSRGEADFFAQSAASKATLFLVAAGHNPELRVKLVARQYARAMPPTAPKRETEVDEVLRLISECRSARAEELIPAEHFSLLTSLAKRAIQPTPGTSPTVARSLMLQAIKERSEHLLTLSREPTPWPADILLAIILGNCRENAEALRAIREALWSMGIPVEAWLVERKDRLFNEFGVETHEPKFSRSDLAWTAQCMRNLSTRVPSGGDRFSYEALASEANEPDVAKIRRIVQRLRSLMTPPMDSNPRPVDAILASQTEWQCKADEVTWKGICGLSEQLEAPEEGSAW
jgi:hypothetical protein